MRHYTYSDPTREQFRHAYSLIRGVTGVASRSHFASLLREAWTAFTEMNPRCATCALAALSHRMQPQKDREKHEVLSTLRRNRALDDKSLA